MGKYVTMMKDSRLLIFIGLAIIAAAGSQVMSEQRQGVAPNQGVPWPAVDALGQVLPDVYEVGPVKPNRFVGIFYFLWIGQHGSNDIGPFDVSKIMAEHPDALQQLLAHFLENINHLKQQNRISFASGKTKLYIILNTPA